MTRAVLGVVFGAFVAYVAVTAYSAYQVIKAIEDTPANFWE